MKRHDLIARELVAERDCAMTADEIAARVCAPREAVLEDLRHLEDNGRVYMRNGFYKPSPMEIVNAYKQREGQA